MCSVMALCQFVRVRFEFNPDGISYLDISDQLLRGDWWGGLNPYWSPMYSICLAGVRSVLPLARTQDCLIAHLVNLGSFALCLTAFIFALSSLVQLSATRAQAPNMPLPAWLLIAAGFCGFIPAGLDMIGLAVVSPDMAMAAEIFCAVAILLNMSSQKADRWRALALGVTLGFAFLTKAAMLPLSVVLALIVLFRFKKNAFAKLPALIAGFALVAAPFIAAISIKQGYPMVSENGKLNYLWHVHYVPYTNWQGSADCPLTHPTRVLVQQPDTYTFDDLFPGATYPAWYNPAYWLEGATLKFDWKEQLSTIKWSLDLYQHQFRRFEKPLLLLIVLLLVCGARLSPSTLVRPNPLTALGFAGLAMFSCVYVGDRYIAPFMLILLLGILCDLRFSMAAYTSKPRRLVLISAAIVALGAACYSVLPTCWPLTVRANQWGVNERVAQHLQALGLKEHDSVASVGFTHSAYWARIAGLHIKAETPSHDRFWSTSTAIRADVLRACKSIGARAVVCDLTPTTAPAEGWLPVEGTPHCIHLLDDAMALPSKK